MGTTSKACGSTKSTFAWTRARIPRRVLILERVLLLESEYPSTAIGMFSTATRRNRK